MRNFLILISSFYLSACTTLLEHRISSAKSASIVQPAILQHVYRQHRVCNEIGSAGQYCFAYYDLEIDSQIRNFEFDFSYKLKNEQDLSDHVVFLLQQLPEDAPLVVIFPGYSMHAADMFAYAVWLNTRGFYPIIAEGPTYQPFFDFGQHYAKALAQRLTQQYPQRKVLLLGYSMGASSFDAFSQQHPRVTAGIAIAPMLNVEEIAQSLHQRQSKYHPMARLLPRSNLEQAMANLLAQRELQATDLDFRIMATRLSYPLLVYTAEHDWLSPADAFTGEARLHLQHKHLSQLWHEALNHPWPELRQYGADWLTQYFETINVEPVQKLSTEAIVSAEDQP